MIVTGCDSAFSNDVGGEKLPAIKAASPLRVGSFSPDGKLLALGTEGGTIEIWDLASTKRLRSWDAHRGPLQSLAFHPDGKLIASEARDRKVSLWRLETGKNVLSIADPTGINQLAEPDMMNSRIAFSDDGGRLAAYGVFWETSSGKQLDGYGGRGSVSVRAGWLASKCQMGFHVLSLKDMSEVLKVEEVGFQRLEISPDGATLAVGRAFLDGGVGLKSLTGGTNVRELPNTHHWIYGLAFTPDSRYLAVGGRINSVCIFDLQTREVKQRLETPNVENYWVGFSPDGKILAAVGVDENVRLWSYPDCKPLHKK